MAGPRTNFAHLEAHDDQLVRLGMLAERYFAEDPNTALLKLRQFAELLAQLVTTRVGLYTNPEEAQFDLLRRLQDQGILPREVAQLFGEVRRSGNAATHAIVGDHRTALATLKLTWQLGVWFHRTFANPAFKSGPFVPPEPPKDESEERSFARMFVRSDIRSKPTPPVFSLQHARRAFSTGLGIAATSAHAVHAAPALTHHQRPHQRGSRAPAARRAGITPSSIDAPSADRKLGALLARDAGILRRTISKMYGQSPFLIPAEFVRNDSTRCAEMVTPPSVARAMFWRAEWTRASPRG